LLTKEFIFYLFINILEIINTLLLINNQLYFTFQTQIMYFVSETLNNNEPKDLHIYYQNIINVIFYSILFY
jgi:hypothetical protein